MWKDFHRLPRRNDGRQAADYNGNVQYTQPDYNAQQAEYTQRAESIQPDYSAQNAEYTQRAENTQPQYNAQPEYNTQHTENTQQAGNTQQNSSNDLSTLLALSAMMNGDMSNAADVLGRVMPAQNNGTAAQTGDIANQQRQMFGDIQRIQSMMNRVQSGDTSALMMELLGSRIPGMENMGNMMNMINMMNNMNNTGGNS